MLSFLKNHPFAVEAIFESSLVLTFAVPKEELKGMIPSCLALDTFDDKWAFIAVAMAKSKDLRPVGYPSFMGTHFNLVSYRVFVRYITRQGKRLRGFYTIGSETNKQKMSFLGNLFTHNDYKTTDININSAASTLSVKSIKSGIDVAVKLNNDRPPLPARSPFIDWKDAREYAGLLPYTFTYNEKTNEVLIVEGVREHWDSAPAEVIRGNVEFVNSLAIKGLVLASAFVVQNIPYLWEKGRLELWK